MLQTYFKSNFTQWKRS